MGDWNLFDLSPFCENDKWGYKDAEGNVVVQPRYDNEGIYPVEEIYCIVKENGLYGVINKYGNIVFPTKYSEFDEDSVDTTTVSLPGLSICFDGCYGALFSDNTYVRPSYNDIHFLEDNEDNADESCKHIVAVFNGCSWGLVDTNGKIIIDPKYGYEQIKGFSEGFAPVKSGDKWGFVDKDGNIVIKPRFENVENFSEGMALVTLKNADDSTFESKKRFINAKGTLVRTFVPFNDAYNFSCGLARVRVIASIGRYNPYIYTSRYAKMPFDQMNQTRVSLKESYDGFSDELRQVTHYLYGYIDQRGNQVADYVYECASDFKDGYARVCLNGKCGIINTSNEFIIEPLYDDLEQPTKWGYAIAVLDKKFGVISLSNDVVVPFTYDKIRYSHENYFIVKQNNLEGIIDINGNVVLPIEYERVYGLRRNGIVDVWLNGERAKIECPISLD